MPTTIEKLDSLLARLKTLPDDQQLAAVDALAEIADAPYELSPDELAILMPALDEALRGENLSDAEDDDLLHKSWA